jgi:hypothetical protein
MQETHCPLCYGPLEIRQVAPCDECGWRPNEIEHFHEGKHTYQEYEVFRGLFLTLCDFCFVDFASYKPAFFGLPREAKLGPGKMTLIRRIMQPSLEQDKFCPNCERRLSFLRFVQRAREHHSQEK